MATRTSRGNSRPPVDEWGIYDPSQAGLEALYGRLSTRPAIAQSDGLPIASSMEDVKRLSEARSTSQKV